MAVSAPLAALKGAVSALLAALLEALPALLAVAAASTRRTCLSTRTAVPSIRFFYCAARPAWVRRRWRTSPRATPGTAWWR